MPYGSLGPTGSPWDRILARKQAPRVNPKAAREQRVLEGGIGENTRAWDALPTDEKLRRYMGEGQGALNDSVNAGIRGLLPEFDQRLQNVREGIQRRGVGGGDTASGYETRVTDDFTRNVADAIAGRSMDLYQTGLDRIYGYQDRKTAQSNAKAAGRNALWGALGGIAGQYVGSRKPRA